MRVGPLLAFVAVASAMARSGSPAATPDHLRCYKVRDTAARTSYSADVTGLVPGDTGCTIKVPGQLLCLAAEKTNVSPPSPVEGTAPVAGEFLCYKVKCPRRDVPSRQWTDQFGTRTVTPIVSRLVCAPALPVMTTTTTITTTTSTTTLPSSPCVAEGSPCAGACGTGVCGMHCGVGNLVCFSNAGASCDTSVGCTDDAGCAAGKVCISSPGVTCSEAFCCSPCS